MITIFSEGFWMVATAIATLTTFLSGLIIGWFKIQSKVTRQCISWAIGIILSIALVALKLITIEPNPYVGLVGLFVTVGLSSTGIYEIKFMKEFIRKIFGYESGS